MSVRFSLALVASLLAVGVAACGNGSGGNGPNGEVCTPGYEPCLLGPPPDFEIDYDCKDGEGDGPRYTGEVRVTGEDIYDLDRDGNGIGCEDQLPPGPVE